MERFSTGSHLVDAGWDEDGEFFFNAMPILRFEQWSLFKREDGFEWVDTSKPM